MKAKVIAEPYHALPCALATFTINGIDANEDDFGEGFDADWENAPDYGCGFHKFEADRTEKPAILEKYKIDYPDYLEICDLLEDSMHQHYLKDSISGYIVRSKIGELIFFSVIPSRYEDDWIVFGGACISVSLGFSKMYPEVTWDSKPVKARMIIKRDED